MQKKKKYFLYFSWNVCAHQSRVSKNEYTSLIFYLPGNTHSHFFKMNWYSDTLMWVNHIFLFDENKKYEHLSADGLQDLQQHPEGDWGHWVQMRLEATVGMIWCYMNKIKLNWTGTDWINHRWTTDNWKSSLLLSVVQLALGVLIWFLWLI